MSWIRHNWLALVVLVAIVGSFFVARADSIQRDADQADALIEGCVSSNTARALVAAFQHRTADARRSTGDIGIANDYDAFARGQESNLIAAKYTDDPSAAAQVIVREDENGQLAVELTPESEALISESCAKFYG
jgi:hypothetical protein